jgi:CheY-like chemotaxis protein
MSKVLIVDDEKEIQDTICEVLSSRLLCQVDRANHGLDGFLKCKLKSYDLIISDHKMPFMLGTAFVVALRSIENMNMQTPIIFLSSYISEELKMSLNIPNIHFMEKPFDTKELTDFVRDIIL